MLAYLITLQLDFNTDLMLNFWWSYIKQTHFKLPILSQQSHYASRCVLQKESMFCTKDELEFAYSSTVQVVLKALYIQQKMDLNNT